MVLVLLQLSFLEAKTAKTRLPMVLYSQPQNILFLNTAQVQAVLISDLELLVLSGAQVFCVGEFNCQINALSIALDGIRTGGAADTSLYGGVREA